ncbi:hypothetical protein TNCV_3721301 [Trichonephila clavipes]|nr:hypothetical protein TNCV_3721301 [Trichonephila clavipes]
MAVCPYNARATESWSQATGMPVRCTVTGGVANVVPVPFDYVGDQTRMLLLPEEVGEKSFPESRSPTFRIDSSRKDIREDRF